MNKYVQLSVNSDLWFEFKLECHRRNSTLPTMVEQLITQQLLLWHEARKKKGRKSAPPVRLAQSTQEEKPSGNI